MTPIAYLVSLEARFAVYVDLEIRACLFDQDTRWATQIAIRVLAMSKCQAVDVGMALVIRHSVVQEPANGSTLDDS